MDRQTPRAPAEAKNLTKEDDADNNSPRVLEQGVVEDTGGQGGHIEYGVN